MNTKLAAALFGFSLCLSVPALAAVPPLSPRDQKQSDDEAKQGAAASAEVNKQEKLVTDPAVLLRVNTIGQKLAAVANSDQIPALFGNNKVYPFQWHFFVIEDKDVNAFSLPGGYVYINSGLLKMVRSDDELAGVLGHEITHSEHHHLQALSHEQSKMTTEMMGILLAAIVAHVNSRDMANIAAGTQYTQMGILNTRYSQAAERDADHGGTIFMQKAGYNPVGMLTFMQLLQQIGDRGPKVELGILQDHPLTPERVAAITAELKELNVDVTTQAVREATGAPRATVHQAVGGGEEIEYAGKKPARAVRPRRCPRQSRDHSVQHTSGHRFVAVSNQQQWPTGACLGPPDHHYDRRRCCSAPRRDPGYAGPPRGGCPARRPVFASFRPSNVASQLPE